MSALSTRWVHIATAAFFCLVLFAVFYSRPEKRCEAGGGRWDRSAEACIKPTCFLAGACGKLAYPAGRCSKVKVGDDRAAVYFQFGEPDRLHLDDAVWHADKGSSDLIVATFRGDKVQHLACPASQ